MSDVATAVSTQDDEAGAPPPRHSLLRRVRWFGYGVLALQLAGFLVWSAILYSRFAVTVDFAQYAQAVYLMAHGELDPFSTILGVPFLRNDSEFIVWIFAPLYWVSRGGLLLAWLQDIGVAGAEAVAFTWICELARQRCRERDAAWLAGLGLLLLAADPWTWWSVSFDIHLEPVILVFAVLMAWDLAKGRRRAWAWVVPVLAAGAATAVYVAGIGLGGVLAGRRSRRLGAALVIAGAGYSLLLVLVHANTVVTLPRLYGYLATGGGQPPAHLTSMGALEGMATHPQNVVGALWGKRTDMVANLAPGGLLGIGAPILLPYMLVVLLADFLPPGFIFAQPLYQNLPLYVLLPVGTVAVLCWLIRRHRRAALALACLAGAQALGWAAVWGPQTAGEWLRVPAPAAGTLAGINARIPATDEVIVSQGVLGRFAGRARVYGMYGPQPRPVQGTTWFVITPMAGVETATLASSMALIGELAGPLHATLVTHANGVWAFRWTPPPGVSEITVPGNSSPLPAWAAEGTTPAAGQAVMTGSVTDWHMAVTGARGYVADGLEWLESPGRYSAAVTLSSSIPVNVEAWDDTNNTLLARRTITPTDGIEQVVLPVDVPNAPDANVYSGWGPFRATFRPTPQGQRLEVRVWSPGGGAVNVYSADLSPAP
jgi:hypothetical protein